MVFLALRVGESLYLLALYRSDNSVIASTWTEHNIVAFFLLLTDPVYWENVHPRPRHMSHVMCHISHIMCHLMLNFAHM